MPLEASAGGELVAARAPRSRSALDRIDVRFPTRGDDAVVMIAPARPRVAEREIRVREEGAAGTVERVGTAVRFPTERGWSFWHADETGAEEWLLVKAGTSYAGVVAASWTVEGCTPEARGSHVECSDEHGVVRVRVTAPEAVTASGRQLVPELRVDGPRIDLLVDAGGEEVLIDPKWVPGGNLVDDRRDFAAVALPDGRVLVAGGEDSGGDRLASAEIYDPVSRIWSSAGALSQARKDLTAALLPDGRVLFAGGQADFPNLTVSTTDIYDPGTQTWTLGPSLSAGRARLSAAMLIDGRVLLGSGDGSAAVDLFDPTADTITPVASGWAEGDDTLTTLMDGRVLRAGASGSFVYDPSSDAWTAAPGLPPRTLHATTRLADGTVLVTGGDDGSTVLDSAHLFDPATSSWTLVGAMTAPRSEHTATLLSTGEVLVASGHDGMVTIDTVDLFEPATHSFIPSDPLLIRRRAHTATPLQDGGVLLCGGGTFSPPSAHSSCETYATDQGEACTLGSECVSGYCTGGVCCDSPCDATCDACSVAEGASVEGRCEEVPAPECNQTVPTPTWDDVAPLLAVRSQHEAQVLPDGRVLVFGGNTQEPWSTEIYDPAADAWTAGPTAPVRFDASVVLDDGRIFGLGRITEQSAIYDPTLSDWTLLPANIHERQDGRLTLLTDGRVLLCGGWNGIERVLPAEVFDPVTETWTEVASMHEGRSFAGATRLLDGKVLVTGGGGPESSAAVEIYDPVADTWTTRTPMPLARREHTATLLPNGLVLVVGGKAASTAGFTPVDATFLYDPATDSWSSAGLPRFPRYFHTATQLLDGRVLIAGGISTTGLVTAVDVYDPQTNLWAAAADLNSAQYLHTAVLLQGGAVLVVGGYFPTGVQTASVERYGSVDVRCGELTCDAGQFCVDGVCCDTPCDAGACDACSVAAGAKVDGTCELLTGLSCDDGNACTQVDQCETGVCTGTSPVSCDNDECHEAATCDQRTGECAGGVAMPNGTPCASGACQDGICVVDAPAGSGGGGTTNGASVSGAGGGNADDETDPDDGCSCRTPGRPVRAPAAVLVAALLVVAHRRRARLSVRRR